MNGNSSETISSASIDTNSSENPKTIFRKNVPSIIGWTLSKPGESPSKKNDTATLQSTFDYSKTTNASISTSNGGARLVGSENNILWERSEPNPSISETDLAKPQVDGNVGEQPINAASSKNLKSKFT